MKRLLLIERYLDRSIFWKNLVKRKKVPGLTVQEILDKYRGIEGDDICFFEFKNEKEYKKRINECLKLKELGDCYLFIIKDINEVSTAFSIQDYAHKVGYEVGICDEEDALFSSIFHEVLFGKLDELVHYIGLLNENLLFSDVATAENYLKKHDELSQLGKDVEDYMPLKIYEIWECNKIKLDK